MKIAVLTNYYPPHARGGAEAVALETVNGLRELGNDVCVLTTIPFSGFRSLWPQCTLDNGVRVYRWFPLNIYYLAHASRWAFPFRFLWTLWDIFNVAAYIAARSVLRREKPEMIVSHNIKGMGCGLPRLARRITSNYVHVLHDVQLVEPSGLLFPETVEQVTGRFANRLFASVMRLSFATVSNVVAPSQFLLDFYTSRNFFSKAKTEVILNPVRVPQFNASEKSATLTIGYVGQLENHKGIFVLLEAWKRLSTMNAQLLIVGGGSQLEAVKKLAEEDAKINVREYPTDAEAEEVWKAISILVVPSICLENSPVVIMRALARGIPIVASNVGGIPELVSLSSTGTLVPPGDPVALSDALAQKILDMPSEAPIRPMDAQNYATALLKLLN